MKDTRQLLAMVAAFALAGCSEFASQPHSSCELMTAQICSRAAESRVAEGALTVSYEFRPEDARVVPFIVPVYRQDGAVAAVVDCYANTDSHTYSIVQSDLAIPPASHESVDFLRARHLCADEGSYADSKHPRIETASALSLKTTRSLTPVH